MYYFSEDELAAQHAALIRIAEYLEEIGWQRRLLDLTEYEILTFVSITIGAFEDALIAIRHAQRPANPEVPF